MANSTARHAVSASVCSHLERSSLRTIHLLFEQYYFLGLSGTILLHFLFSLCLRDHNSFTSFITKLVTHVVNIALWIKQDRFKSICWDSFRVWFLKLDLFAVYFFFLLFSNCSAIYCIVLSVLLSQKKRCDSWFKILMHGSFDSVEMCSSRRHKKTHS